MEKYDLIVIGSGPAGQRAAIQGAKFGKRVVLIERREVVGGVCINTGTIPSKTLREAVLHFSGFIYQGIYGIELPGEGQDHHGRPVLPRAARHQDRSGRDSGAALAQQRRSAYIGLASFTRPTTREGRELARGPGIYGAGHRDRDRNQARGVRQGSDQRPHDHQQRPDHADAGDSARPSSWSAAA